MKKRLAQFVAVILVLGLIGSGIFVGWVKYQASNLKLPSLDSLGNSVLLSNDGKVIGHIKSAESDPNHKSLSSKEMPNLLRQAHMAAEDRSFYKHGAVSASGTAWAIATNFGKAGGSTITQQYAKKFVGSDYSLERKTNELIYALKIEQQFTKTEIIDNYMNANYYGRGAYGIDDAARTWFGVSAKELSDPNIPKNVARAAFLAALIKSPGYYESYKGKPSNLTYANEIWRRTLYVLDGLRDLKGLPAGEQMVSAEAVGDAKLLLSRDLRPLGLTNTVKQSGGAADGDPYLAAYIKSWLTEWQIEQAKSSGRSSEEAERQGKAAAEAMLTRGGLKIYTTIEPKLQKALDDGMKNRLAANLSTGGIALNAKTGAVVAMHGGRNFSKDANNYAIYAKRPPGSTMKAFVLANAVSRGISVQSVFAAPANIDIDGPLIWDHTRAAAPGCKMTLAEAAAQSNNVVFVEAATGKMASCSGSKLRSIPGYSVTPSNTAELMHEAGADVSLVPGRTSPTNIRVEPRLAIGDSLEVSPLKLAAMGSPLASGGELHQPFLIKKIEASNGEVIFEHEEQSKRVFDEDDTAIVNKTLTGVFDHGTAAGAGLSGHPLAGKTGTTERGDAWMLAYNAVDSDGDVPTYVFAAWAGNRNGSPSSYDVARVSQYFFGQALQGKPRVDFSDADLGSGRKIGQGVEPTAVARTKTETPAESPSSLYSPSPSPTPTPADSTPPEQPPNVEPTRTRKPERAIPTPLQTNDQPNKENVPVPGNPGQDLQN